MLETSLEKEKMRQEMWRGKAIDKKGEMKEKKQSDEGKEWGQREEGREARRKEEMGGDPSWDISRNAGS